MWSHEDLDDLGALSPTEQLWVIALAVEDTGGPSSCVDALRMLACRLEDVGWWLREPTGVGAAGGHP